MKNLIINTRGSHFLSIAVEAIFGKMGKRFCGYKDGRSSADVKTMPFIYFDETSALMHSSKDHGWPDSRHASVTRIDAATEMGKLIELLEEKEVVIKKVAFDGTRTFDATLSKDGRNAKIGCSTVEFSKVEEVYLAMKEQQKK